MNAQKMEAASGFEPLHRGFADLSLNHLGTPPERGMHTTAPSRPATTHLHGNMHLMATRVGGPRRGRRRSTLFGDPDAPTIPYMRARLLLLRLATATLALFPFLFAL